MVSEEGRVEVSQLIVKFKPGHNCSLESTASQSVHSQLVSDRWEYSERLSSKAKSRMP